ncbi:dnaJ (Hsp40), sub C, member 17 [Aspergillus pseudoviridinutans]|uniref:DnaJ (Hsp40), sub C, member 17 n=1 Tax=Aspergillus pseudoviridinutans TaxID=1517512 RepID=A0A9P3EVE0_9EURO|nr:dnaJ (Hsp40), sub C, member 17 [Aspergillus pseudoviridinutans]GIJ86963.1 dnaJ (Hsp40), sub C, member 17 [Aspergillus pseudoviridinutans]
MSYKAPTVEEELALMAGPSNSEVVVQSKPLFLDRTSVSYPPLDEASQEEGGKGNQGEEENENEKTAEMRQKAIEDILNGQADEYLRILGVTEDSTERQKIKAYRKKALLVHPDQNKKRPKQAKEAFNWLRNALEKLKDPETEMPDPKLVPVGESWHANAFSDSDTDEEGGDGNSSAGEADDEKRSSKGKHAATRIEREAPEPVKRIYEDVTADVLQLLQCPEDEGALQNIRQAHQRILQYYDELDPPVNDEEKVNLEPSLLQAIARTSREMLKKLEDDPGDVNAEQIYRNQESLLDTNGRFFGWPTSWRLAKVDIAKPGIASTTNAGPYVERLKVDPDNAEAISKLQHINRAAIEYQNHNASEMALDGKDPVPIDILRDYYRTINSFVSRLRDEPNDVAAYRKAETINDEFLDYLNNHDYPRSWAINIRDILLDTRPKTRDRELSAPKTRDGEQICGYRSWKNGYNKGGEDRYAYLFAVLPDQNVPIGVLRSGSLLGQEAKREYLAFRGKNEVRKYKTSDEDRWQELERVFVHTTGTRHETWVQPLLADRSATGQLEHIERPLMTRTEYRKLRCGIDGDYDIVDLYEKHGLNPPNHVMARLPRDRSSKNKRSVPLLESSTYRRSQDHDTDVLDEILAQLRRQSLERKQGKERQKVKERETKKRSERELAILNEALSEQTVPSQTTTTPIVVPKASSATATSQDEEIKSLQLQIAKLTSLLLAK